MKIMKEVEVGLEKDNTETIIEKNDRSSSSRSTGAGQVKEQVPLECIECR